MEQDANNLYIVQLMPCHPIISYFIKIQIGLTFLVLAYSDCPGKEAVKLVSVCLVCIFYKNSSGDEIANVNFFYNIAHVEASDYAH